MADSIAFDRAAGFYDRTRALPAEIADRQTELLAEAIGGRRPVVEIGVGTGRIALPLSARSIPIVGIDLSRPMLDRLRDKPGGARVPVAMADATRLPFADRTVGAVIASHVLHLIPRWTEALSEVRRVLQPGGALLQVRGGWGEHRRTVARWFLEAAGRASRWPPGASTDEEVDRTAARLGFEVDRLPEIGFRREVDLGEYVARLEEGVFSATWEVSTPVRRRAGQATRGRLAEVYGSERPVVEEVHTIGWRVYRKP